MKVTNIAFVGIPVTDVPRSQKFYEGVLGLKKSGAFMEDRWIEYEAGSGTIAIGNVGDDWKPSPDGTSAALEVDNFDGAIAELKKANVTFDAEPFESPVCHMAIVRDPDGNKIIIHKLKGA